MPDWRNLPPVSESEQPVIAPDWTPSQTFLRHQDRCDRAAYLYLTEKGAGAHHLHRGGILHQVIERLLRLLRESHRDHVAAENQSPDWTPDRQERLEQSQGKVPPEIGLEVLYEVMEEESALQVTAEERDNLRYMVDHWCRGTHWNPKQIIGIEKTLTLEIEGFRVLIRPDLLLDLGGGTAGLVDWKSAFPPDSEEFKRQAFDEQGRPRWAGNFQLNMAAVVMAFGVSDDGLRLGRFERFRLILGYPRILYLSGIAKREVEVDHLQVQHFRDDLALQLRRLREVNLGERRWQATPSAAGCPECPCAALCPLPEHLRPESAFASLETREELEAAATAHYLAARENEGVKRRLRKAAEALEERKPGALDLGDGQRGVRVGPDVGYVFSAEERETIRDKAALRASIDAGHRVEWANYVRYSESVTFEKRKLAPRD